MFLASISGAKPYHRLMKRGVKLIGANCTYATAELDEVQSSNRMLERVRHDNPSVRQDLVMMVKILNVCVLARAVKSPYRTSYYCQWPPHYRFG